MKNIINLSAILFLSIILSSCGDKKSNSDMDKDKQPQVFNTPDEAAKKGKNDMLSVLKNNKDINLNIEPGKLESSQPGKLVKRVEIDFSKLLKTDSVSSLSELSKSELNTLAPLVAGNEIIGIVEINKVTKGWQVAGLGNRNITTDINVISKSVNQNPGVMDITVYEVPNLQIFIYEVKDTAGSKYFLNDGSNNLREGVSIQNFYPSLKEQAMVYEKNYGEIIRKQKVVK
ncbi:MAG: hypothetical protein M3R36_09575 [Bacteroidota bacterium]|nr:hypothetical protein [Bacteroidota bacterium]